MKWLKDVSYWHRVILTVFAILGGSIAGGMIASKMLGEKEAETGSYIGAGISIIGAIWLIFVSAPTPEVSSFGDPLKELDPYADVSTRDLKQRYAQLNNAFHFFTDAQRREHDRILHSLLMRGERP